MIVCITEKPSVARDIASILGAKTRRDGYFEGNGYCITWTFGHLCTLKEPAEYNPDWKRWGLHYLPMIPERFGIRLIRQKSIFNQFRVIKNLVASASSVINCGDAGQEGELIQRWVLQKAEVKCPVKRLWISSLTDDAIRQGFEKLRPSSDFDNLYYAGLSRAIGDWVLGLNATRLYTLKYSQSRSVLSVGRVQTPTLALVVQRQIEIDNFKPEKYWELVTKYRDTTFKAVKERYSSESDAADVLDGIKSLPFDVTSVETKNGKESPQKLFDLTSLQVETNKLWGWSADYTLKLIQSLYEKKVTTYPRVDTTYLTDDIYPKVPDILKRMTPYAPLTAKLLSTKLIKPKRIFDNSKVTDHHAIIPTGQSPTVLDGDEKKLYHIIALRFIAAFYPDSTFLTTIVVGKNGNHEFKATGKVIENPGWRAIYGKVATLINSTNNDDSDFIPEFKVGECGPHIPEILAKETQPPKLYTEGTLLRAMETAGRNIDDEELREAMKVNGIGRPSTRASIIETLFKRGYIEKRKKSLIATNAGIELIATINEELLKSAKLTGIWENKLRRIEMGDYSARQFLDELKSLITKIVSDVKNDTSNTKIEPIQQGSNDKKTKKTSKTKTTNSSDASTSSTTKHVHKKSIKTIEEIKCPQCGKGHLLKGKSAYGCNRYKEGCNCVLPFSIYPPDLSPTDLKAKIRKQFRKK